MFGIRSLSGGLLLFRQILNYAHLTLFNKINLHSVVIHVIFVTSKQTNTMKTKINISDFSFLPAGFGHYKVTYTSPTTGKKWTVVTSNMPLIDATKNAEEPKRCDLEQLKRICKN